MGKLIDLTGKKFGKLTVIKRAPNKNKEVYWDCYCDCGNNTIKKGKSLKNGDTKSCGCLKGNHKITHGMTGTVYHKLWKNIKNRCFNKNSPDYYLYGERGISLYDDWINNFKNFYDYLIENLGERPDDYSLDRMDCDKNYEPGNLRWADNNTQARNQRNNQIQNINEANEIRRLFKNKKHNRQELATKFNCSINVIRQIINNETWNS